MVEAEVERKEAAWNNILETRDEVAKSIWREFYKKKIKRLKGIYARAKKKKKVNQQFRCFVWKEVSKVSRGKVNGEIVKDENDMVVEWIWRLYCMAFEGSVVS